MFPLIHTLFRDRSLPLGAITLVLCLFGWASNVQAQTPSPSPSPTITPEDVQRFARAGLMIENARRQLEQQIGLDRIKGLSCNTINGGSNVEPVIQEACQKFNDFVGANELAQDRFNEIYLQHQTDPLLARRILTEMTRICLDTRDSLAPSFCQDTIRPEMLRRCTSNPEIAPAELCDRLRQPAP
ncbi:MAG: DUF4168 domain-containing protein [Prochlorotrichaceae cyanobacterium]|jgi:hypothetical protein